MASMTRNAVAPFAAMLVSRVTGARVPNETTSTTALAAWNSKKPGIIETTAEKPSAANGRCRRSTTGVTMMLTRRQPTSAPVATLAPASEISAQRAACPEHAGQYGERQHTPWDGEEGAEGGNRKPCRNHISHERHGRGRPRGRDCCAAGGKARQETEADHKHDDAGIGQASDAKSDPRAGEIDRAVEKMRTRHQHHAGTECDEGGCDRLMQADGGDGCHDAGDEGSAKRLDERVSAQNLIPSGGRARRGRHSPRSASGS